jgi:hypothetical protein
VAPTTRITPRHVYEQRHNTRNVSVPSGYKTVWKDDRLNPHRADRTAQPARVQNGVTVPSGYRMAVRGDDRHNPNRGLRTVQGDGMTDQIWQRTLPRTLIPFENDRPVIRLPQQTAKSRAEAPEPVNVQVAADLDEYASNPLVSVTTSPSFNNR